MSLLLLEISAMDAYVKGFKAKITPENYGLLLKIDPTIPDDKTMETADKGQFTDWLVRVYSKRPDEASKDRMLTEDGDVIRLGLSAFAKLTKNKEGLAKFEDLLPGKSNYKDINQFTVEDIKEIGTKADTLQDVDVKAEKKIEVIFNGQKLFMCIPQTHEAARKYGTGTTWCTASGTRHWYDKYTKNGPLLIIINKEDRNEKWQFHDDSGQLMDRRDRPTTTHSLFNYILDKEDSVMEDEFDQIAEILGEHYGYKVWQPEAVWASGHKDIADIRKVFGDFSAESVYTRLSREGLTLLGYCYIKGYFDLAELLLSEFPNLKVANTDVIFFFTNTGFAPLANQLELNSANLLTSEAAVDLYATTVSILQDIKRNDSFLMRLHNIHPQLPQDYFTRLGNRVELEKRLSLVRDGKLLSQTGINSLISRSRDREGTFDSELLSYIKALFPELDKSSTPQNLPEAFLRPAGSEHLSAAELRTQQRRKAFDDLIQSSVTKSSAPALTGDIPSGIRQILLAALGSKTLTLLPETNAFLNDAAVDLEAFDQTKQKKLLALTTRALRNNNLTKPAIIELKLLLNEQQDAAVGDRLLEFIEENQDAYDWEKIVQANMPAFPRYLRQIMDVFLVGNRSSENIISPFLSYVLARKNLSHGAVVWKLSTHAKANSEKDKYRFIAEKVVAPVVERVEFVDQALIELSQLVAKEIQDLSSFAEEAVNENVTYKTHGNFRLLPPSSAGRDQYPALSKFNDLTYSAIVWDFQYSGLNADLHTRLVQSSLTPSAKAEAVKALRTLRTIAVDLIEAFEKDTPGVKIPSAKPWENSNSQHDALLIDSVGLISAKSDNELLALWGIGGTSNPRMFN